MIALLFTLLFQATESEPVMIDRVALKVNDKIITERELLHTYSQRKSQVIETYEGSDIQAELEKAWEETVTDATDQLLLFEKAVESGLALSEDALESRLLSIKEANGFNDETFEQALLEQTGMNIQEYIDYTRRDESARRVIQSYVIGSIEIEDSEISKYFTENSDQFMEPATYRIAEIAILKNDNPSVARFKAGSCKEALQNGTSFEEAALQFSDSGTKDRGGDLGVVEYGDLNATLEQAASALQVDQVSDVLETETAYFIIKVLEKSPAKLKDIDEVKEQIRYKLQEPRLESSLTAYLENLRNEYLVTRSVTKPANGY